MASQASVSGYPASSRAANIVAWILQVFLAVGFFAAAGFKLSGAPMMVEEFAQIGLGQGFRYVTAAAEIIGAIGLLAPRTTALGGLWTSAVMIGATMAHLLRLHTSPAPPLVLLVLSLVVVWLRRAQLVSLRAALG